MAGSDSFWRWRSQYGQWLTLRAIRAEDRQRYAAFVAGLSYGTRYFRFGNGNPQLSDEDLALVCRIDATEGRCFVIVTHGNGEDIIVGAGDYFSEADGLTCTMSIVVADAWQGTQIAHRLMATLIECATDDRFKCMRAQVLATNRKMLRFMQRHGFTLIPEIKAVSVKCLQLPLTAISL